MRLGRTLYAWYKYLRFLAREFRASVTVFSSLVLLGGLGLQATYHQQQLSYGRACYAVFCMIFFETGIVDFPSEWYLQPFFFLVPILGLGAVADSVVRLGYFVFTSKQKLPEWHIMQASTMRNHIVVCGVGKVGYRIIQDLLALKEEVVAIEKRADNELVTELMDRGFPIIIGESRLRKTLEQANVQKARAVILATDDDLANLDAALTAREINPDVRVVLRLFDDTLASKVATAFNMPAISTSSCAAPNFIAAATNRNVFHAFELAGKRLQIADLRLGPDSRLIGHTVGELQAEKEVNVVMHMRGGATDVNPSSDVVLRGDDHVIVIAPLEAISRLEAMNR
ncbi:MAG: TrkA family potassium uptake protein [Myxococcota bacterium]